MQRKRWMFALFAILPTLVIFAYVRIYPIGDTLRLSLHKWDILSKNKPFIGLANFEELTGDPLFREALLNTTVIAFGVLIITIPLALVLAALIYHRTHSRFAGFYEAAIFIPHVVSLVPAAMAWKWIFDARLGPLNALLTNAGFAPKSWLFDPVLSVICVIVLCSWQALGYAVIIYLVGFKSLPNSLYEAAELDGASAPSASGICRSRCSSRSRCMFQSSPWCPASTSMLKPSYWPPMHKGRQDGKCAFSCSTCLRTAFEITASAMPPPRQWCCWRSFWS